jgi:anti-sigma factor RsiW
MLNCLVCHYTRMNLDAFIDGELSPRVRRRVAQHLDRCSHCDRRYVQRRQLRRELQQALPLVGHHIEPDYAALWQGIQVELPRRTPPRRFRYGLVMMMILLALVVPLTMGNGRVTESLPEQPVPQVQAGTEAHQETEPQPLATAVASSMRAGQGTPPTIPEPLSRRG